MTNQDAKRYVCRVIAATLVADFDNASGWLEEGFNRSSEPFSAADRARVRAAAERLMHEMSRRGGPRRGGPR